MYKLLILFVFFSLFSFAQVETPMRNQNSNSIELEEKSKKKIKQIETQSLKAKPYAAQREVFLSNVDYLQSELKTISLSSIRKSPTPYQQSQMEAYLKEIGRLNGNSFEYHLLNYQVGNYDFSKIESLKAAEKLKSNDVYVLKELSAYSYIQNDQKGLINYLNKLNSQRAFSKDLEVYAANVLKSLPENSVFLSHGESDTYPLLIQQKLNNIGKSVEIISLDHLQSKDYRNRLKLKGFNMPNSEIIDTDFFINFVELNKSKNIIAATSIPQPYLKKGKGMNTVGLGFSFEKSKVDDYNLKYYNSELKTSIENHVNTAKDTQILTNYLPFLFSVRNIYIENGDNKSLNEIEMLMMNIGKKTNKSNQINLLLNK